jgi:hypothetical protein
VPAGGREVLPEFTNAPAGGGHEEREPIPWAIERSSRLVSFKQRHPGGRQEPFAP